MQDYLSLVKGTTPQGDESLYGYGSRGTVAEKHQWWKDAVGNPGSKYSDYLLFEDSAHTIPATIIADLRGLNSYDGSFIKITTVNLKSEKYWTTIKNSFPFSLIPTGMENLMMAWMGSGWIMPWITSMASRHSRTCSGTSGAPAFLFKKDSTPD